AVIPWPDHPPLITARALPRRAGVIGPKDATGRVLRRTLDRRVDTLRIRGRDRNPDATKRVSWNSGIERQLFPGIAAVRCLPQAAVGGTGDEPPRCPLH